MLLVINYERKSTTSIRNIMSEANNYYACRTTTRVLKYQYPYTYYYACTYQLVVQCIMQYSSRVTVWINTHRKYYTVVLDQSMRKSSSFSNFAMYARYPCMYACLYLPYVYIKTYMMYYDTTLVVSMHTSTTSQYQYDLVEALFNKNNYLLGKDDVDYTQYRQGGNRVFIII